MIGARITLSQELEVADGSLAFDVPMQSAVGSMRANGSITRA